MTHSEIFDSIKINFRKNNAQEIRMAAFLRSQKEMGKELKSEVMKPLYSFLDTFSVGADPNSTSADIETAFITSMIAMSSQMSTLALYCRVEHGINLSPDSLRTFGLLPSPIAGTPNNFLPTYDNILDRPGVRDLTKESVAYHPPKTVGQKLSQENQEWSEEIDREIAVRSTDPVPPVVPDDDEPEEDDYDPDYDPEDDLSEEEYLELVNSRMTVNIPVIVD